MCAEPLVLQSLADLGISLSQLQQSPSFAGHAELMAQRCPGAASTLLSLLLHALSSLAAALQLPEGSRPQYADWFTAGCISTVVWSAMFDQANRQLRSAAQHGDRTACRSMSRTLQAALLLFHHVPLSGMDSEAPGSSDTDSSAVNAAVACASMLGSTVELCSTPCRLPSVRLDLDALLAAAPKLQHLLGAAVAAGMSAATCQHVCRLCMVLKQVLLPVQQHVDSACRLQDATNRIGQLANGGAAVLSALPYLGQTAEWLRQQPAAGLQAVQLDVLGQLGHSLFACIGQSAAACLQTASQASRSADQPAPDLAAPQAAVFSFHTKLCRLLNRQSVLPAPPDPIAMPTMVSCLLYTAVTLERLASGVGQIQATRWACYNAAMQAGQHSANHSLMTARFRRLC